MNNPSQRNQSLMKLQEVADHLRVCTRTVRRMIKSGELPTIGIRGAIRISRGALERYIDNNRKLSS